MMKAVFRSICVFLLVLCVSPLRAETITHDFDKLFDGYELKVTDSNKTGTIRKDTVYTCSGGATFGFETYHADGNRLISVILPSGGVVTTTPAIEGLTRVTVKYYTASSYVSSNLKLYVSEDGLFSGDAIPETRSSRTPFLPNVGIDQEFEFPKGDYYIKLVNTSSEISIFQIDYTTDPSSCACLQVVSQ